MRKFFQLVLKSDGYLGTSVVFAWTFGLFSLPVALIFSSDLGYVFGTGSESFLSFSNKNGWMLLFADVARGNLFPIAPSLGGGASGLSYFPYLSLWLGGTLVAIFGLAGAMNLGEVLLPFASFVVVSLIYRKYLPARWSFTLAALGLFAIAPLPLRGVLKAVMLGEGWVGRAPPSLPDVAGFPFPSFSLFCFLVVFYFSVDRKRLTSSRLSLLTLAWSLQVFVHPVNAVFGIPLWFTIFPIMLWRQRISEGGGRLARIVVGQIIVCLIICLPVAWGFLSPEISNALSNGAFDVALSSGDSGNSRYYYFAYFIIPLSAIGVIYVIDRIDYFELIVKFWIIFVLMFIEFVLVACGGVSVFGLSSDMIDARIGIFFLHMFYYVPVLYYLCRENRTYALGVESQSRLAWVRRKAGWFVRDASLVYLPIVFFLMSLIFSMSAVRLAEHVAEVRGPLYERASTAATVLADGARRQMTLVSDIPSVNLMVPMQGQFGSLWVNRFANRISEEEAIERQALYAHLVGWSEEKFLHHILPGDILLSESPGLIELDTETPTNGMGNWLVNQHRRFNTAQQLHDYRARVVDAYWAVDVSDLVLKYKVGRLLLSRPSAVPTGLAITSEVETSAGTLYYLSAKSVR